ncbi:MAG: hypothetical protein A3K41_11455 [Chloroflexi bacterium RIFOXYD12_FULL_57_15]|nr:MAG: hypothetical protein A3K41_11455 [Chloroflexi bacterium RIFOXYD12_FULL_57_15]
MSENIAPNSTSKRRRTIWVWAAASAILLVLFAWVYYFEPIKNLSFPNSDYWNDKATDVIILVPALATAISGALLTRHFKPSEPPYRIWLIFTLGWWAWVGGEVLGFVYDYFYWFADYPEFTFIDVFWLLGYVFFGLSLYYQFRLIYSYKRGRKSALYFSFIAIGLLLALGLTQLALAAGLGEGYSWAALYLAVIYPVFDLAEGAAALWLFFLFGRGYLGRPWWGLIAFAVADGINIFFWIGGYNWLSDQVYYSLDLFSNVAYVAGYLITALAFLAAHEHIERGITASASSR